MKPKLPKGWQIWAGWLVLFIGSFLAVERKSLRDLHAHVHEGGPEPKIDPLTSFLRFILFVRKDPEAGLAKETLGHLGLIAFGGFWLWLIAHLASTPGSIKSEVSELKK